MDPTTTRFFAPLGANEMFVSSLLGWGLQADDEIRRLFLDAVAAATSGADGVREAAAILRDAADVEVTVESYATVGNIDIALFSRVQNVVLIVEHKTGTALSERQITKYIHAMRAADPRGDRKVGVVLLRPDGANDARDAAADKNGFTDAIKLSHSGLPAVWDAIEKRLDSKDLGSVILEAALRHARGNGGEKAAADNKESRRHLLERVRKAAEEAGWAGAPVKDLSAVLHHPHVPDSRVRITIGASSRSMITCQLGNRRITAGGRDPHLLDLLQGSTAFAIPTPFPCDHHQKPWMPGREADLEDQVQVVVRMLAALLDGRVSPEERVATSPGN